MADQPRDASLASTEQNAGVDLGAMTTLETATAFVRAEEARKALESVGWWPRAAIIRLNLGLDAADSITRATAFPFLDDALSGLDSRPARAHG